MYFLIFLFSLLKMLYVRLFQIRLCVLTSCFTKATIANLKLFRSIFILIGIFFKDAFRIEWARELFHKNKYGWAA
jgi:hypothetical protein